MAFEDRIVSDVCCLSILVLDSRACAHAAWFDCSALIRLGYVSDWCFLLASLTLQLKDVVPDQIASLIVGTRQAPKADSGLPATQRRATAATDPDVSMVLTDVFRERHSKSSWTLVPSAIRHPFRHQFYMEVGGYICSTSALRAAAHCDAEDSEEEEEEQGEDGGEVRGEEEVRRRKGSKMPHCVFRCSSVS
jgi:hypothetical protein